MRIDDRERKLHATQWRIIFIHSFEPLMVLSEVNVLILVLFSFKVMKLL